MGFTPAVSSQCEYRSNRQAATVGLKTTETPAGSCMSSEIPLTVSAQRNQI